jgi:hypothetical protein
VSHQVGVSNTEASSSYACELAWGLGFHPEQNWQLREMGEARQRGIYFHEGLEIHYKGLMDGRNYDECAQDALNHIQKLRVAEMNAGMFVNGKLLEMLNWNYDMLQKYFEHYRSDIEDWEILGVESFYAQEHPNEDDFYLPSRVDLVVYHKRGEFKGETSPVDHKTTYDFWLPFKFQLNSQFPLYIRALRDTRFPGKEIPVVKRVIVNQVRTRKLKDPKMEDLFRRKAEPYTEKRIQTVFQNHMKTALRLAYLKRLPWEEALEEFKISLGSMACQYCDFKDVCNAFFDETDMSKAIAATMKRNEYGYPPLEEIRARGN